MLLRIVVQIAAKLTFRIILQVFIVLYAKLYYGVSVSIYHYFSQIALCLWLVAAERQLIAYT